MICSCTNYFSSGCRKDLSMNAVKMSQFSKTSTCETYLSNICSLIRSEAQNRKSLDSAQGASIKTLFNDSKSRAAGSLEKPLRMSEDDFGFLNRNMNFVRSDWEQIKCISGKTVRGVQTQYREPLCRACLATDVTLIDMFSERILEDFIELAGLNMDDLIQVPMMLCESCYLVVNNFIQFRKRCSMANKALLLSVYGEHLTTASKNLHAAAKSGQHRSASLEFEPYLLLSDNVKRLMATLQQKSKEVSSLEPTVQKVDHKLSPFEIREADEFRLLRPRFGANRMNSRKDEVTDVSSDIPVLKPRLQSRSRFSRRTPSTPKKNDPSNLGGIFDLRPDADTVRVTKSNKCKTAPPTLETDEGDHFGKTRFRSQEFTPRLGKTKFCRRQNDAEDLYQGIDKALFPRYPCGELKEYLDSEIFMPELCGVPASELLKQNDKIMKNFHCSKQDGNMQGSANESSASIFSDSLFGGSDRETKNRGSRANIPPREEITAQMFDIGVDAFDFLVYSLNVHINKDIEGVHLARSSAGFHSIQTPPRDNPRQTELKSLIKDVGLYCSSCELDVPSVQRLVRHVDTCETSRKDGHRVITEPTNARLSSSTSFRDKTLDLNECHSEQFYDCSEIEFDLNRDHHTDKSMPTAAKLATTPDLLSMGGNDLNDTPMYHS